MRRTIIIILTILLSLAFSDIAYGQYSGSNSSSRSRSDSNSSSNNPLGEGEKVEQYTLTRYFNSLAHKDTMAIGWSFGGNMILPGTAQIYNKQAWKLPIFYTGIAGMLGGGIYFNSQYQKTGNEQDQLYSTLFFVGAGIFYWAQLLDGAVNFPSKRDHLPGRATVYSILFPGLGQIYNREYWKLPIYYGGLAAAGYFWYYNDLQYKRFQADYNRATDPNMEYDGALSAENLKYYRDYYRRYRDYSIVATVLLYLIQIIDADVFATMYDFNITDEVKVDLEPAIIEPLNYSTASQVTTAAPLNSAVGLKLNFTF